MPKRSKKKTFSAASTVKSAARNVLGSPRPTERETPKPKKSQDKHRATLQKLLSRDE